MKSSRTHTLCAVFLGLTSIAAAPAFGALSATATISGTPNGPYYDYTILVKNTGDTNIGTFWFAWTPPGQPTEYDFLPTTPISATAPNGWYADISDGFPGTSIDFYNYFGDALAPGQTDEFDFTTTDTPDTLKGKAFGFFPITESFIYEGFPQEGTPSRVDAAFPVPEPSSLALLGVAGIALVRRRRTAV